MQRINNEIIINEEISKNNKGYFYFSTLALILFSFYISTQSWLFTLILKSNMLQIGILLLIITLLIFKPTKNKTINFTLTRIDILWSFSVMYILFAIYQVGIMQNNDLIFVYILGLVILIIAKLEINRFVPALKLLEITSILYAVTTIFHYLFTDIFHSIVFPFVSSTVQQRMLELVNLGYYPGLGFAQPSMAAAPMVVGIGLYIARILSNRDAVKKIDMFMLIILFIGLIMAGKRSILLWGILTALFTYYFSGEKGKKLIRSIKVFTLSLMSLFILFLIMNYFDTVPFFSRIVGTIDGLIAGDDVTSGRTVLYDRAWELFRENPIFGIGWDQFLVVTSGQLLARDLTVHNVYLQILTEMGIVGFVIIIIPFAYVYFKTIRTLKKVIDDDMYNKNWRMGISFSFYFQTFFLLYCISENPFYNVVYMFLYFFSITIVNSFHSLKSEFHRE